MSGAGDAFIAKLAEHPEWLPEVDHDPSGRESEARIAQHYPCQLCGEPSDLALTAEFEWPIYNTKTWRWLDLCDSCAAWTVYDGERDIEIVEEEP